MTNLNETQIRELIAEYIDWFFSQTTDNAKGAQLKALIAEYVDWFFSRQTANTKATQIKDLPLSEAIIDSDVLVKQNTTSRQTQSFTPQTLLNYARQGLDIDTIEENLTSLVNRIATLENLPHIIYSNYRTRPYYEVYSNGMCRQWSMPDPGQSSSAFTENTSFAFAIPYKNTNYLLYPVGFDISNVGAQQVTFSTTGFTTSSMLAPCGTRCWVTYGEVDLNQISNYI